MEWLNYLWFIIATIISTILILVTFIANSKMRYSSDFAAMERSRSLENGVLHNERRYLTFATHIQKIIQSLMAKLYLILFILSVVYSFIVWLLYRTASSEWRYCVFYFIGAINVLLSSFLSISVCKPFDPKVIIFSRISVQYSVTYVFNKNTGAVLITLVMTIVNFWLLEIISTSFEDVRGSTAAWTSHSKAMLSYALGGITVYVVMTLMKSLFKLALGYCTESFLMKTYGANFIGNPCLSIGIFFEHVRCGINL